MNLQAKRTPQVPAKPALNTAKPHSPQPQPGRPAGRPHDSLTEPEALDIIYALMSPEVHHILAVERHWTADHYEQWLARTLAAALLPPHASITGR
jgi:hypothetical protein